MSLWTALDTNANSAPKNKHILAGSSANGATLYANVSPSASFQGTQNMAVGMFGIDITETQFSNSSVTPSKGFHSGWNLVRQGTGPVLSINITAAGTGYNNTNLVVASNGTSNASATINTHANGTIQSILAVTAPGKGFVNVQSTVVGVTNATGGATGIGSGATFTPVLGGRAGRIQYETLVAMGMANTANGSGAVPGIGI